MSGLLASQDLPLNNLTKEPTSQESADLFKTTKSRLQHECTSQMHPRRIENHPSAPDLRLASGSWRLAGTRVRDSTD